MSNFADLDERKPQGKSQFRRMEYLELGDGMHTVRILDEKATKYYTHYVNFSYVKCLGDECPICENNKKLIFEHPKDFRSQKGFRPRSERYYVNVLDKTPGKVCSNCGKDTKELTRPTCKECGSALNAPQPLNKVKVLAKGRTLFEDLNLISNTVRDAGDNVVPITGYDYLLIAKTSEKGVSLTPTPRYTGQTTQEVYDTAMLFDLSNAVPELTREELVDLMNGASLKDIFALRRAAKQVVEKAKENSLDPLMADVAADVDALFGG